ncbi:glycosyltransferase family 4 protein [Dysgonomonas sp. 25]|uniref:glycosyltransferase family 4 protein n=1 Tax=Dysgonomonas sp. 25 TaxID=2302933 RepID=UPI0013D564D3|nr:glycosyltransferase family 4 protein [Dysgonomonas sp. 25]NDV69013.1 glycosyltransferase [Dysgonomonas sp. 25]
MNIGIAGPIEVYSLKEHLNNLSDDDLTLGLGGTAINTLIDGFIKAGHNVIVFTLDRRVKEKYILQGDNLKIIFGYFRTSTKLKMLDFDRNEYKQIAQFIKEEENNIDIVNAHWSYEFAIGTILSDVPHLITFRDHAQTILRVVKRPYLITRLLMNTWVKSKAKNVMFNSPVLKERIGLEGFIIPNPIKDTYITTSRKFPKDKNIFYICFIANSSYYLKNPINALKAFSIFQKKNDIRAELHFIGNEYSPESKIAQIAKNNNWDKNVIFKGDIKFEQMMEALDFYDLLLHTSREESFGNTLIEAMAKGIPVIGGVKSGAVPWVLDNGEAGCLVDVEDVNNIAEALACILSNPLYYEQLSSSGINNLKNRFSQKSICSLYVDIYNKIINTYK